MNTVAADARGYRLTSIDMLRGMAIIIMAIDHTRDFFHTGATMDPMEGDSVSVVLALTRWITHFCAPVFVLLSGTSAGLMVARKSAGDLCVFLLTRGLWLVFVEIALISTAITFSPGGLEQFGGRTLAFMQVIWAIGASMVVLAFAQFLGRIGFKNNRPVKHRQQLHPIITLQVDRLEVHEHPPEDHFFTYSFEKFAPQRDAAARQPVK